MLIAKMLLASWFAVGGSPTTKDGVIAGSVLNASRGRSPEAGSEVVLRVRLSGQFVPFDQTKTDALGRFRFVRVPVGESYVFRTGANRDGIHYPGPVLELTAQRPAASVELAVYDSVAEPCPLVIRRQEIALRHEPGALQVTEAILVDNPSKTCYVGRAGEDGSPPVTLQLAIPPEFSRTTFQEEFYGRRFQIVGGKLTTGVPWPPGQREVKFTYTVPTKSPSYRWQRPLDLPCDLLRIRVENAKPDEVACNLRQVADEKTGALAFDSAGPLLAGNTVCVELGRLPVPLMADARWLALAILGALIAGVGLVVLRRQRRAGNRIPQRLASPDSRATNTASSPMRRAA